MYDIAKMLISAFVFIAVFGSILFLAYVTTRFIGKKSGRALKGKHINILETVSLGLDSRLHLVKIGEEFVLISSSGKNIQLLTKVRLDDYSEEDNASNGNTFDFKEIFEKYIQNFKGRQNSKTDLRAKEEGSGSDDNSFKRNLVKLRTITSGIGKNDTKDGDENTDEIKG